MEAFRRSRSGQVAEKLSALESFDEKLEVVTPMRGLTTLT